MLHESAIRPTIMVTPRSWSVHFNDYNIPPAGVHNILDVEVDCLNNQVNDTFDLACGFEESLVIHCRVLTPGPPGVTFLFLQWSEDGVTWSTFSGSYFLPDATTVEQTTKDQLRVIPAVKYLRLAALNTAPLSTFGYTGCYTLRARANIT